jgi:hypothetical protein
MGRWFEEPEATDNTWARHGEGQVHWLARSTLPRAYAMRAFLNRNISLLPEHCREGVLAKLRHERHFKDGFFELVVGRTLQEFGAVTLECELENAADRKKPDFTVAFSDGTVVVEATSPAMDKQLGHIASREAPIIRLIQDNMPPGWAANIRKVPQVGPGDPRRHIKNFLRDELNIAPPKSDYQEVRVRGAFEQGDLDITLLPQSRHGLSPDTKIAMYGATAYFPNDTPVLRRSVQRKYPQLKNAGGVALVALNMTSTTAGREDLDRALFGVTVSRRDQCGNEVGRYFHRDGLWFAGGEGEPTIAGVLAFPEVGFLRCVDPMLYVHPRFKGQFPAPLRDLERREAPTKGPEVIVTPAKQTGILDGLGFVQK